MRWLRLRLRFGLGFGLGLRLGWGFGFVGRAGGVGTGVAEGLRLRGCKVGEREAVFCNDLILIWGMILMRSWQDLPMTGACAGYDSSTELP